MSTAHPTDDMRRDVTSRITQAAIVLADEVQRLERAQGRLKRALDLGRKWGLSQDETLLAVLDAATGRPDRARALETYAQSTGAAA
ncbi:MAG: hypothetical protein WKF96_16570 [Solirubrobacteraceae bacterium]